MHFVAILNCDGGTLKNLDAEAIGKEIIAAFEQEGHHVDLQLIKGEQLEKTLEHVGKSDADGLIIGGGDGSVSAGAATAWKHNKTLVALPAGTMNLFARSLQLPLDLSTAIEKLAKGKDKKFDIATANGRPFVHHYSIGLHPRAMRERNKADFHSRYGKMFASLKALGSLVVSPPKFKGKITLDDAQPEELTLSGLALSNNKFGDHHLPYADTLDGGVLGVYPSAPVSTSEAIKLMLDVFAGGWKQNERVEERICQKIELEFNSAPRPVLASIDGELIDLPKKVEIEIHPKSLTVRVADDHSK